MLRVVQLEPGTRENVCKCDLFRESAQPALLGHLLTTAGSQPNPKEIGA
jgi:hypothetical protein